MSKTENVDEVLEFYENGAEINRLERGLGIIEAARTKEILSRYVKPGCKFSRDLQNPGRAYFSICKNTRKPGNPPKY